MPRSVRHTHVGTVLEVAVLDSDEASEGEQGGAGEELEEL